MAKLDNLTDAPAQKVPVRMGPTGLCDIYGPGDLEDYLAVHRRRLTPGESWLTTKMAVDQLLGVERPIPTDKFRYHWNGHCRHWQGVDLP